MLLLPFFSSLRLFIFFIGFRGSREEKFVLKTHFGYFNVHQSIKNYVIWCNHWRCTTTWRAHYTRTHTHTACTDFQVTSELHALRAVIGECFYYYYYYFRLGARVANGGARWCLRISFGFLFSIIISIRVVKMDSCDVGECEMKSRKAAALTMRALSWFVEHWQAPGSRSNNNNNHQSANCSDIRCLTTPPQHLEFLSRNFYSSILPVSAEK